VSFLAACHVTCRKDWTLLRDDSIFVDWQHLKVQENVEEVSWANTAGHSSS
jgi:DNA replicative helicase MCM subunit Mcm2 (Cdc46/Mcm family)